MKEIIENKMVKYPFSVQEQADLSKSLARSHIELREVNGEFDRVKAQFKSRIVDVESKISLFSDKVNDGFEYRSTPCRVVLQPTLGKKQFIIDLEAHPQYGQVAYEEQMASSDYQLTLDDIPAKDAPKDIPAIDGLTKAETQALVTVGTPDQPEIVPGRVFVVGPESVPVKRGRGRPRKNSAPTAPVEQASIAPEPAQGEVLAPESVSTDPETVQEDTTTILEGVTEVEKPADTGIVVVEPSEQRAAFVFDYEELENFVTSNGFTLEHCKKAAASFNLLTGKESITTFSDFGEVVAGKLLNARRGFASRMALIKQNEEAQNPPEI